MIFLNMVVPNIHIYVYVLHINKHTQKQNNFCYLTKHVI